MTSKIDREAFKMQLEKFIDENSVEDVTECLEEICQLKAEHIRTYWQDWKAAQLWQRMARSFRSVANTARRRAL